MGVEESLVSRKRRVSFNLGRGPWNFLYARPEYTTRAACVAAAIAAWPKRPPGLPEDPTCHEFIATTAREMWMFMQLCPDWEPWSDSHEWSDVDSFREVGSVYGDSNCDHAQPRVFSSGEGETGKR